MRGNKSPDSWDIIHAIRKIWEPHIIHYIIICASFRPPAFGGVAEEALVAPVSAEVDAAPLAVEAAVDVFAVAAEVAADEFAGPEVGADEPAPVAAAVA